MKHDWFDPRPNSPENFLAENFRRCYHCGAEQTYSIEHVWGRIESRRWEPLVGRCRWIAWEPWTKEYSRGSLPSLVRRGVAGWNKAKVEISLSRAEEGRGRGVWHMAIWIGGKLVKQQGLVHFETKKDAMDDIVQVAEFMVDCSRPKAHRADP